jgi:hypothetical protein
MSLDFIVGRVNDSFDSFITDRGPKGLSAMRQQWCGCKGFSLMDCIAAWVESGHGVRACAGDFQTYLIAIIMDTDAWHREADLFVNEPVYPFVEGEYASLRPASLDRREHSCSSHADDNDLAHRAYSQSWFATQVFDRLHPESR